MAWIHVAQIVLVKTKILSREFQACIIVVWFTLELMAHCVKTGFGVEACFQSCGLDAEGFLDGFVAHSVVMGASGCG